MSVMIEVRELKKIYRGNPVPALNGVDLTIDEGEFFGLLGPNAAGKTTLISAMCGLLKITSGSVIIKGLDVTRDNYRIRKLIGLIPQEIALYPTLTIRENMEFFARMYGLKKYELKHRVGDFLELLKLQPHEGKRAINCSGGIRRRANLMCGLIHEPEIIFLDEPTLGVDAQSMNLIYEYLMQLNKSGKTIIFTTHYMREAENLLSRVTIIDDGRIIANGSPSLLIKENPGCRDLGEVFLKLTGKELRD
jgi:ABC-2 type transport system ATP-binding protein